jgi:hypothetical protein
VGADVLVPPTSDGVHRRVQPVQIAASSSGVRNVQPAAVLSIVVPEPGATESVEAVYFLTAAEAFELGRLTFGPLFEQLRSERRTNEIREPEHGAVGAALPAPTRGVRRPA